MKVNPDDGSPEIYVTWSDPRMTDFENVSYKYLIITMIDIAEKHTFTVVYNIKFN